ncbi:hypothetical protein Mp_3g19210 [Marchantia polymorpha subsp. ruderalis]|uniref:Uncharacterized protein n=2 Tax=Marchantia polymorpha TaxID=3197 RepID=A0AAF6B2H0_MARPO|nr:hypothetical protein MARPO_0049s0113 [Marchantia polymorpha]BBN06204.1 hypothetical protein Mp_3g19210 [Marchantia polymorpha subsp. ruderalis]|eukprot:PTQ38839.1 hypothetical protein MARPO_0049s0113 [Marchantia polymorpha]
MARLIIAAGWSLSRVCPGFLEPGEPREGRGSADVRLASHDGAGGVSPQKWRHPSAKRRTNNRLGRAEALFLSPPSLPTDDPPARPVNPTRTNKQPPPLNRLSVPATRSGSACPAREHPHRPIRARRRLPPVRQASPHPLRQPRLRPTGQHSCRRIF